MTTDQSSEENIRKDIDQPIGSARQLEVIELTEETHLALRGQFKKIVSIMCQLDGQVELEKLAVQTFEKNDQAF